MLTHTISLVAAVFCSFMDSDCFYVLVIVENRCYIAPIEDFIINGMIYFKIILQEKAFFSSLPAALKVESVTLSLFSH